MFDNNTQDSSDSEEIFDSSSDQLDEAADAAQSTDTQEDESDEKDLVLDEQDDKVQNDAPNKANVERDKQAKLWANRIKDGEVTLDSLPSNLHWLRPYIARLLPAAKPEKEQAKEIVIPEEKIEEIVERTNKKNQEKARFLNIRSALNKLRLTKSQKEGITSEFKDLTDAGLSKAKALEKAAKIHGIDLDDGDTLFYQQAFAIPSSSGREIREPSKEKKQITGKTSSERVAELERIRRGEKV